MQQVPHQVESTGTESALYMALELGAKRWLVAFGVGAATPSRRHDLPAGDRAALRETIADAKRRFGLAAAAPVRSCYEAGRDGFWIHRMLATEGIANAVVDSASIEVSRRARHAKTDRLDADKLLRMLIRYCHGERAVWKVVRVPTREVEDARHAERALTSLVAERTRQRSRLKALLALHGVQDPIRATFGDRLAHLTDWAGAPLPAGVTARVALAWRQLSAVEGEIRLARQAQRRTVRAATTPAARRAVHLHQLRGIRIGSALMLAKEVFVRDLANRRQVGALSGFVAVPYQSGDLARDQGISRAGIKAVRRVMVELAWVWVQWQPNSALTQWYQRRFATGGPRARRIGIVALARKLLIALWRYSEQGIVPAGAVLRG
ncbi:MAG: transposase [Acidobacteria bacterium]|nr:transposase [Acidobacteriota bacterium]